MSAPLRALCEHGWNRVVPLEDENPRFAGASEVGGTGLDPVTPSWSRWRTTRTHARRGQCGYGGMSFAYALLATLDATKTKGIAMT